jgi:hypothetical protein
MSSSSPNLNLTPNLNPSGPHPRPGFHYVHVGHLERAAQLRKSGYVEAVKSCGPTVIIQGDPFVMLTQADYDRIREEFGTALSKSVPGAKLASRVGLGDAIHAVAGPIGRAINWPCMKGDGTTNLRPGSPCAKLRDKLNRII